jgi:hypothetical protein
MDGNVKSRGRDNVAGKLHMLSLATVSALFLTTVAPLRKPADRPVQCQNPI